MTDPASGSVDTDLLAEPRLIVEVLSPTTERTDRHEKMSAYKNCPGAVEFLAKKGAKIEIWNRKNSHGWTPLTIAEGHRFGNFKPSPVTVAAFHRVMQAAGVPIPDPEPVVAAAPEPE